MLVNKEMLAFATPYPTVRAYSDARPVWFNRWTLPPTLRAWLLSMEEHTFYLFIYMTLATLSIRSPTSLSATDRESVSARLHIYKQDLIDEIGHFKAFSKVNDQAWLVSEGVLAHVRSVIGLRFPLNPGYSFVRAPDWTTMPPQHPGVTGFLQDGLRPLPLDCMNPLLLEVISPLLRSCLFSVLVILVLLWTMHSLAPVTWHRPSSTLVFTVAPLLLLACVGWLA